MTKMLSTRSRHFNGIERKLLLVLLEPYKHIVECKKGDSNTNREKEIAWTEVCNKYNESSLIAQERTVQQLKKLWSNLKHNQKEAIIKEKQARMKNGGEPQESQEDDTNISLLSPHIMTNTLMLFSPNQKSANIIEEPITDECVEQCNNEPMDTDIVEFSPSQNKIAYILKEKEIYKKKKEITENVEENIGIEKIVRHKQLANIKVDHKKKMAAIKEDYLRSLYNLKIKHLKELHELEIRIKKAKLHSIERKLLQK